jgi:dihydroxyacetone kinase
VLTPDLWKQLQTYTTAVADALLAAKDHLNTLDGISGDGDCGLTLARGATACLQLVQPSSPPPPTTSAFLVSLACAISDSMGGTSGVLLEILFRAMARSLTGGGGGVGPDAKAWATALHTGVERLSFYGGAKPGYRTMIDALLPAEEALSKVTGGLQGAAVAARAGAEKTKTMTALAGRANYVPVEKTQGHPDPGAEAIAVAFEALASVAAGAV